MPSVNYFVAAAALLIGTAARLTRAGPFYEDDDGDLDFGARERPLQRATSYVDALIPLEFQVRIPILAKLANFEQDMAQVCDNL